jgi:hypothetical protein
MNNSFDKGAEAGEIALKAHVLWSRPELCAEITDQALIREKILCAINLTEAPEDAVCSLVIDLLSYCEREKIDWAEDVMARTEERLGRDLGARTSRARR